MSGNHHLYVPGPSNVPAAVQQAIHCPMEDHRNPTIPGLITPLVEDLKKHPGRKSWERNIGIPRQGKALRHTKTAFIHRISTGIPSGRPG